MQTLADHKCLCSLKIQCAFRSKIARNTFRSIVCSHNMEMIENKTRKLQKFWRRCSQERRFFSKIPWMIFPWPSGDVRLESSSWSVSHAYDVRLEMFMQSKQFDDYDLCNCLFVSLGYPCIACFECSVINHRVRCSCARVLRVWE